MDRALEVMTEAARAAGEIALKYFRRGVEVTLKPDRSPVTQADREAEEVIVEILGRAFPDHGFLGEELGLGGRRRSGGSSTPSTGRETSSGGFPSGPC